MYGRNFWGRGQRGGMGMGFRGNSPPWPYVGRGRGGLPRCSYYFPGAVVPPYQPLVQTQAAYTPFSVPMSKGEDLGYLKDKAQSIKEQLDSIESRMRDLGA